MLTGEEHNLRIKVIWRKFLFWFRKGRFAEELAEEMRLHMELRAEQIRRQSSDEPAVAAEAAARRQFGNPAQHADAGRDVWTWRWLDDFCQDLRFAGRLMQRKPGATTVAILTLGLGIGAASSVFSIVDAVLLRPLPYKDPSRLVVIWGQPARQQANVFLPYSDFAEWSRSAHSFENLAAATWAFSPSRALTGRGPTRQFLAIPASASFFNTLGVPAERGRTFTAEDERRGCTVVLTHSFWNSTLGADPAIVGRSLTLDQRPCTVVGVMPASFSFYPVQTNMWILLGPDFEPPREKASVGIFARLKPGVTREQAQAEVTSMHHALHGRDFWRDVEPRVYDLHDQFTFLASRTLRVTLIVVFAAVLLVLLIACLNVANLLLARLSERQREFAMRAALGSGQARLVRQVLTEGLLLSLMGTAAGVLFAYGAVRYFRSANPIELTAGAEARLNLPVFLFSAGLAAAATLLCSLLPAISASRIDIIERLKTGGRGAVGGGVRQRTAKFTIAAEMALSVVLLIGAGLLLRSALGMGSEPLGFNPEHLFQTAAALPLPQYRDGARRMEFSNALLDRLNGLSGVAGAALTSRVPPYPSDRAGVAIEIQGKPGKTGLEQPDVAPNSISSNFFVVAGIPLRRGRRFNAADRQGSQPVAIINEALAREYFSKADPIGQQIRMIQADAAPPSGYTIVGVAGDVKHPELLHEMSWVATPILYLPIAQDPRQRFGVIVRASGTAPDLGNQVERQIAALDPSVPINEVQPVSRDIARILAYPRFRAVVLGFFALMALLLSAVGLHGVLSQLVAQRTAELGVRKAVGAQNRDIAVLVGRQGGVPVFVGLTCGIACTVGFSRLLASLLYGIRPADPEVLVLVSLLLLAVAAIAVALPARRAALVDPMVALRDE